ncbi:MAG: hypothetical protein WB439_17705 [Acidobacteriaceae bacterium]
MSSPGSQIDDVVDAEKDSPPTLVERRALIHRAAGSSQFARSARLRDFLLYVGNETLKKGVAEVHEQDIGMHVFGRPENYDRSQDNIVRVNATELRKRIDIYFSTEGAGEPVVFSIPRGSYKPVFRRRDAADNLALATTPQASLAAGVPAAPLDVHWQDQRRRPRRGAWGWIVATAVLAAACGWLLYSNHLLRGHDDLWAQRPTVAEFWIDATKAAPQTDIVLPDASASMSEEILGTPIMLSDYLDHRYIPEDPQHPLSADRKQALQTIFNHNLVTLGDFHAAQQILGLTPIAPSFRLTLSRFYEADSLKRDNVVLIGGKKANPWVRMFDPQMNFSLDYNSAHNQIYVLNRHPRAGEQAVYESPMDRNTLTGYCVVAYLPDPGQKGNVIIFAGTDSDATGAAAEFLTTESQLRHFRQLLHSSRFPYFEVLLKTSRLSGTSFNAEIVAFRTYPNSR